MTTIEEKLKLFSKIVYDKIQLEKQKDFDVFEKEKEEALNEIEEEIKAKKKEAISEITKKSNLKANEIITKEKLDKQQALLELKEELIKEVLDELKEKLSQFTDSDEYKNYLMNAIKEVLQEEKEGEFNLIISKKDIDRFEKDINSLCGFYKDIKVNIKATEKNIIGGMILEDISGRYRINNTLIKKVEENKEKIGISIINNIL